ncbi:hypothetical protein ACOTWR_00745 [Aliarcobacter butzleri]
MKKYILALVLISGIIPILGIIKSLSFFDFYFMGYLIYIFIKGKIKKEDFSFIFLFLSILITVSSYSLVINSINPINNENIVQSIVYIFRLFEMFLFLYVVKYFSEYKIKLIHESIYLSILITFITSIMYSLLVFFNIIDDVYAISGTGRLSSFFGNANGYAYFLVYVFITNLYFTKSFILRSFLVFVIVCNILLTASFSAIILLLGILVLQINLKYLYKYILSLIIIVSTLYIFFDFYSMYLPNRILNIISNGTITSVGTYSTRSEHIMMALNLIQDNIEYFSFLGLGLGNSNIFIDNDSLVAPHNSFINLVLMIGIIPTLILLSIFLIVLINLYKKSNDKKIFLSYVIIFLGQFFFSPIAYLPHIYIPLIMGLRDKLNKGVLREKN